MIIHLFLAAIVLGAGALQASAQQAAPPANAAETLAHCTQVQPVVHQLLDGAAARLEAARQTNSAAALRAAVDDVDGALRDLRVQLAPCANVESAEAHAGHVMPTVQRAPGAKPPAGAVDPHAGHTTPATKSAPSTAKPATAKPSPSKPPAAAKPPADEHAGHTMPAAKPAPSTGKPATAKPSTAKPSTSKPSAAAKPPADEHAGHAASPQAAGAAATAVDPVCGLKVDPSTAPSTKHNGQTYYFCSPQHQQLFQKNPAKFVPKRQ